MDYKDILLFTVSKNNIVSSHMQYNFYPAYFKIFILSYKIFIWYISTIVQIPFVETSYSESYIACNSLRCLLNKHGEE